MRPSTIFYILKQGIKNIKRNWMFSVASVLTMSACIFLFAIFFSIVNNLNYIAKSTEEKVPITVFFDEGISQEQIDAIGEQIKTRPEVESIVYQSADEAWEKFRALYFPEDSKAAEGFKDDNPLIESSNYQISLNDLSKQADLVAFIQSLEGVRKIEQAEKAAETLSSVSSIVYYVSAAVIGILLLISVFLISNTISVGISVRGEEIGIMKYIGATDRFVRAPFVLEGIILGAVGAIIPLVAMFFIYNESISYILTKYSVLSGSVKFMSVYDIFRSLIPIGLLLGIGIGLVGSFWTTRKHLRV
ncbi:MAG: permease-like cell division protein FtsX [Eubacteriales bacterium]|nr:permease-like cell division protein FtsX [Eubacteriales bacterium]